MWNVLLFTSPTYNICNIFIFIHYRIGSWQLNRKPFKNHFSVVFCPPKVKRDGCVFQVNAFSLLDVGEKLRRFSEQEHYLVSWQLYHFQRQQSATRLLALSHFYDTGSPERDTCSHTIKRGKETTKGASKESLGILCTLVLFGSRPSELHGWMPEDLQSTESSLVQRGVASLCLGKKTDCILKDAVWYCGAHFFYQLGPLRNRTVLSVSSKQPLSLMIFHYMFSMIRGRPRKVLFLKKQIF